MDRRWVVGMVAGWIVACGSTPPRGACMPHPPPGTVGSVCGFTNPEDVEAVPSARVLLVSQMRPLSGGPGGGSVAAVTFESLASPDPEPWQLWPPPSLPAPEAPLRGDASCTGPPDPTAFSPHGVYARVLDGEVVVAAVSHAPREAVELFELQGQGRAATLVWRGCVPLPPSNAANDLAIAPDGALVVANCMPSFGGVTGALSMLSANLGADTGDVMVWSPGEGWRHMPNTDARMANGIAVDARRAFFTETGSHRVARMDGLDPVALPPVTRASLDGAPDNLAWTSRGTLVTASHLASWAFIACAIGRRPCRSAWELLEIDPQTLASTVLVRHDGDVVGAVSSATEIDGVFYLGAVFGDRIGVWSPAR